MRGGSRARAGALAALVLAVVAAGCSSGSGDEAPAASTASPPPGFPREAASGTLADRSRWTLTETGLGQVCLHLTGPGSRRVRCVELTATWVVGTLRRPEATRIVFAGLPCGVAEAELRSRGERLDGAATVARDDVAYIVLEGPASLEGVVLVARDRTGGELFRVDRLDEDPSARVPTVGC